jgi:hypothetical protein
VAPIRPGPTEHVPSHLSASGNRSPEDTERHGRPELSGKASLEHVDVGPPLGRRCREESANHGGERCVRDGRPVVRPGRRPRDGVEACQLSCQRPVPGHARNERFVERDARIRERSRGDRRAETGGVSDQRQEDTEPGGRHIGSESRHRCRSRSSPQEGIGGRDHDRGRPRSA